MNATVSWTFYTCYAHKSYIGKISLLEGDWAWAYLELFLFLLNDHHSFLLANRLPVIIVLTFVHSKLVSQ